MSNDKVNTNKEENDALRECRIKLMESEQKFLLFSSQCTDQMGIISEDGHFKYIAPLAENFLGYADEDLLKTTIFALAQPQDAVHISKILSTILSDNTISTHTCDARLQHKNGNWVWHKITFTNKSDAPLLLGIVAKFCDITDQKEAEKKIFQLERFYAFSSQINKAISHATAEQSLLSQMCQIAINVGKFEAAWVTILDSETGNRIVIGDDEFNSNSCSQVITDYFDNQDPFEKISNSGVSIVCNLIESDLNTTNHVAKTAHDFNSFIVLPLRKAETVVGTFTLCAADPNFFTAEEIMLLEEATADISHELETIARLRIKREAVALLRKTEANLQSIINSTSEGFVLCDMAGIILECNVNAINAVYLYSQQELEKGKKIFDFVPIDRKEDIGKFFKTAVSGEIVTYDNSYGDNWFNFTIFPVYNVDAITGVCFTFKDITERKLAEQKLMESELFSKDVLSSLHSHIAVIDAEGTLLAVNKAWEDYAKTNASGNVSNVLVGSNYFDVCKNAIASDHDDAKKTLAGILSVFNKDCKSFQMEYPCPSPDEDRWFTLHVSPFGADVSKVVISHQDITERKIAENELNDTSIALKKTLTELNKIVDSSLDVICTIDAEGKFLNVSKASKEMWGYDPHELIGNVFMDLVFEEDVEKSIATANEMITGKNIQLFENRYVHKNGKLVSVLWSTHFDEQLGLLYCVAKDITEQKRLENVIEKERDQFYHMFLNAPTAVGLVKGPDHIFEMTNPLYLRLIGKKDVIGERISAMLPELLDQGFVQRLDDVYHTGVPYSGTEVEVIINNGIDGESTQFYLNFICQPYKNDDGIIDGVFFFINDVSEQVIARKSIEKSERFFKGVIESSADMIILMDATGKRTYATPAVIKTFGYTQEVVPDLNFMDVIYADDLAVAADFFAKVLQNPLVPLASPILRALKSDGTHFWVEGTMTNFIDTEGIHGIVANFRDVTERKVVEDNLSQTLLELAAERNRLVTAQRVSKIGSWETDLRTFQIKWSDEMHRIFETDPNNFLASHYDFLSFVAPEDRARVDKAFMASLNVPGTNCIEHHIITADGRKKCVEENWTVSNNEKGFPIIAIGTCQDITERNEAAAKVQKSETKLKVAQLIAQVGSWEIDLLNDEHSWSDEFYRILGIDPDVQPSEDGFLANIYPDDRAMVLDSMRASSQLNTNSSFTFRFIHKNGDLGYASTEWRFEFDHNRVPIHIFGILRDMTKIKVAENERIRMISDLMQRNKDLEQFSYIISHNLRAPVANIMGLAEELSDQSYDAETKLILTEALNSDVKRLENVIVDLNTILQTKREITEMKELVSLGELVSDIKMSINDLIQMQGVHITTDFTEVDEIHTIKSYIQSIFFNLITNSIKYRKPFTVSLIEIKSQIIDGKLVLVFKDNGSGIDLVKKGDQIFGLYKRFHANTEGKGMGLYMVKTQVETLGGQISVDSAINNGTEFRIEFGHFSKDTAN